jgi:hypothetical protein
MPEFDEGLRMDEWANQSLPRSRERTPDEEALTDAQKAAAITWLLSSRAAAESRLAAALRELFDAHAGALGKADAAAAAGRLYAEVVAMLSDNAGPP